MNMPECWRIGGSHRTDDLDTSTIVCNCGQRLVLHGIQDCKAFEPWIREHAPHMDPLRKLTPKPPSIGDENDGP
jgi:hypothetical protein